MPAATFFKPIEDILNGKCQYEYYSQDDETFSVDKKTRICHIVLNEASDDCKDLVVMIFTIRNQPNPSSPNTPIWKIHSEGPKRTDPGSTVPLRDKAIELSKKNKWKYMSLAIAGEGTPTTDLVSEYVIAMESYDYGNETVYVLTDDLEKLNAMGKLDYYRSIVEINGKKYSFSFIKKDKLLDYIEIFDNRPYDTTKIYSMNLIKQTGGTNVIYYGAPGCGKSFLVNKSLDDMKVISDNRIRVTFHPEYSNSDFIGQILPTVEKVVDSNGKEKDIVKYTFYPGPFTLALKRASETNDMVYLIIEEINRGNASAIFGDLFQLLDRKKDFNKPNCGESEYPICNPNIQKYLNDELKKEGLIDDEITELVIPSNLSIVATMNSSDQNVFTLDTAFKRRWSFVQIGNDIVKDSNHKYKKWYIPGTNVTWEQFLTAINAQILDFKIHNQTNEDKRLGKYFVSKDCLTEKIEDIANVKDAAEKFAYKVLEYLWNDVCKIGREDWFDVLKYKTLEDLIEAFVKPESGESPLSIFINVKFN